VTKLIPQFAGLYIVGVNISVSPLPQNKKNYKLKIWPTKKDGSKRKKGKGINKNVKKP
jgi:hypothetical protein